MFPTLAVLMIPLFQATGSARADYLLGVTDGTSLLLKIDPTTGAGTLIHSIGEVQGPEDIQADAQGRLITVGYVQGRNTSAYFKTTFAEVDPNNGQLNLLKTSTDYRFFEGLANVNGVLYASASTLDSYGADTSDHLVYIDPVAGTFTEVGKFGPQFLNMEDIAYSPKYGLVGVDIGTLDPATNFQTFHTTPAFVSIDITTGVATKIADLPPSMVNLVSNPINNILSPYGPFLCGLDFAPDGTLYASTFPTHFGGASELIKIDPVTGAITDIGPIGFNNVDGLYYVSTAVPEPESLSLLVLGGVASAVVARRRGRVMA